MSDAGMGPLLAGFAKLKPKAGIALAELADASHRVEQATGIVAPSTDARPSAEPPTANRATRCERAQWRPISEGTERQGDEGPSRETAGGPLQEDSR